MTSGSIGKRTGPRGTSWFYRLDIPDAPDGRRRQQTRRGFPTRKSAQAALNDALQTARHGGAPPLRLTVADYLQRWLRDYVLPTRRQTTYAAYESCVRVHLTPRFGAGLLADLSPLALQQWLAEEHAAGIPPMSTAARRAIFSSALRQAVYWGLLAVSPWDRVRGRKAAAGERPVLVPEQVRLLLTAARGTDLELPIHLTLLLSLRRGEILGLRWQDVDLAVGTLTVRRTAVQVRGPVEFNPPKSAAGIRPLPFGPLLADLLRRHRGKQAEERLQAGPAWQDHGLVLPAPLGLPRRPRWLTNAYAKLARKISIDGTFHDLRHSHATFAIAEGVDVKVLQARLGHASVSTTLDIYGHLLPGQQQAASEATERAIRRAMDGGA